MDPGRRFFLRGGGTLSKPMAAKIPRPPWALEESAFVQACTRCNACVEGCPQHILSCGDGGFPIVKFESNGCTECGECAALCIPKALTRLPGQRPWAWHAEIDDRCLALRRIECRVCGEVCDAGAIRFRPSLGGVSLAVLSPQDCTGCGQCVPTCPTSAIKMVSPAA